MVNNFDWTAPLSAIEFLRDVGKHFRVNRMLARRPSRRGWREEGISYTEFSYQLLQAYDYLELHRRYGCTLQTGGSDQWGNITAGVDLVRRVEGSGVHALPTPLVTKADGTKFGKTEGGAVWLDPELTSPYAFYQFWLNADDARRRHATCGCSRSAPARRSRRWRRRSPSGRRRGRRSGRWPRSSPRWCTAQPSATPVDARPAGRCSAGASSPASTRRRSRRAGRGARGPGRRSWTAGLRSPTLLVATGLAASKSAARRTIGGGRRLREQRRGSTDEDARGRCGGPAGGRRGWCCAGASATVAGGRGSGGAPSAQCG